MTVHDEPPAPLRLPEVIPIFPLAGALLLPRGHMPLHVFEPRYRRMTEAAIAGDRVIGMIQPRRAERETAEDGASIYDTGCAGRIVSFTEAEDGRFLIMLRGVSRFRVVHELPLLDGYRRVEADFSPYTEDMVEPARIGLDRDRLLSTVRSYVRAKELTADWEAIKEASDDALVIALAMMCPFEPREKQALLECRGGDDRTELLISLLDMGVHASGSAASGIAH